MRMWEKQMTVHTRRAGQTEVVLAWDGWYWFRRCKYPAAAGRLASRSTMYQTYLPLRDLWQTAGTCHPALLIVKFTRFALTDSLVFTLHYLIRGKYSNQHNGWLNKILEEASYCNHKGHEDIERTGGVAKPFLTSALGHLHPWAASSKGNSALYPLKMRLGGPQRLYYNHMGREFGEKYNWEINSVE